jgi:hypothetical protein
MNGPKLWLRRITKYLAVTGDVTVTATLRLQFARFSGVLGAHHALPMQDLPL